MFYQKTRLIFFSFFLIKTLKPFFKIGISKLKAHRNRQTNTRQEKENNSIYFFKNLIYLLKIKNLLP